MKKVLVIAHTFPPGAGSGMFRTLKFVQYLPENGWLPAVLTVKDIYNDKKDHSMVKLVPKDVKVFRTWVLNPISWYGRAKEKLKAKTSEDVDSAHSLTGSKEVAVKPSFKHVIFDFFTTPDKFIGWLFPGTLRGLSVIRKEKIDLIYSTSPVATTTLISLILKRLTGKPWVADFRDPWTLDRKAVKTITKTRLRIENWLESMVFNNADSLILNTEYLKKAYLHKYKNISASGVNVITNGYDSGDFTNIAVNLESLKNRFTISHVGEFYENDRTPDSFLIAVGELLKEGKIKNNSVCINLVGGGEYTRTNEFKHLLREHKLEGVVNVVKRLKHRESLEYMLNSHVLLLLQPTARYRLQIPAKAFEYIRAGRFVFTIAPDGATSDLTKTLKNGVVFDEADISGIKNKIYQLYQQFCQNELNTEEDNSLTSNKYDRRALTQKLAGFFSETLKKKEV